MEKIARFLLMCMGWKVDPFTPKDNKYVLIVAPHTSNWDFIIGRLAFWTKRLPAKFLIKREFFKFPLGFFLKLLGGLPVDRSRGGHTIEHVVELIRAHDKIALIITPEGTRQYNAHWKKGFYYIARKADVPLYIGIVDYAKKECKIVRSLALSGDFSSDMASLKMVYQNVGAKYPKQFSLPDWE